MSVLLFFGKTVAKKDTAFSPAASNTPNSLPLFNVDNYIHIAKKKLPAYQAIYLDKLENSISGGNVKEQQLNAYSQIATFWKDSVKQPGLNAYYNAKAAKLENSEKNLTFAAQLILDELRNESDPAKRNWEAEQAIELFEKAIELDPQNDNLKVSLGSCYVFGKGMSGDAQETMKGIQQLLQVVRKDSANMQAQLVLGIGGVISRQYDKAVDRLLTVIKNQPGNLEAISWLADAYAGKNDKANALKWYEISKRLVNNPQYSKEVNERIKMLQ